MMFLTKIEKAILKFTWNRKTHIAKGILGKTNKVRGITLPGFKTYCKAVVTKTAWHWHKNTYIDQQDRIEGPEVKIHIYSHLSFATLGKRPSLCKCC